VHLKKHLYDYEPRTGEILDSCDRSDLRHDAYCPLCRDGNTVTCFVTYTKIKVMLCSGPGFQWLVKDLTVC
jgi:hypothetical protein